MLYVYQLVIIMLKNDIHCTCMHNGSALLVAACNPVFCLWVCQEADIRIYIQAIKYLL